MDGEHAAPRLRLARDHSIVGARPGGPSPAPPPSRRRHAPDCRRRRPARRRDWASGRAALCAGDGCVAGGAFEHAATTPATVRARAVFFMILTSRRGSADGGRATTSRPERDVGTLCRLDDDGGTRKAQAARLTRRHVRGHFGTGLWKNPALRRVCRLSSRALQRPVPNPERI